MRKALETLDLEVTPTAELAFFDRVTSSKEPKAALRGFAPHYHYFSTRQIHAFAGVFRLFTPADREVLTTLSEVLYEEMGEGQPTRAHSLLLERFIEEIGGDKSVLPLDEARVAPGVREYVECLYEAFWGDDLPKALATYCFLENSAVKTYPKFVEVLNELDLSDTAKEFFVLHTGLEVEHAKAAQKLVTSHLKDSAQASAFNRQFARLRQVWERFWVDITHAIDEG